MPSSPLSWIIVYTDWTATNNPGSIPDQTSSRSNCNGQREQITIIKQGSFIVDTCIVLTSSKNGPDSSIHRHSFIVNNVYFLTVIDIIYYNINVMHYLEWNKALHPLYDSCRCGPEMRST